MYFQAVLRIWSPERMLSIKKFTSLSVLIGALVIVSNAIGETATSDVWSKFEATRQGMRGLHQEFEVVRRVKSRTVEQVSRHQVVIDFAKGIWREQAIGGDSDLTRLFDGQNLFVFEPGGTEYTRAKQKGDNEWLPEPYETKLDWGKAKEVQRLPCGFTGKDHACVIIDAPVKPWVRPGTGTTGYVTTMTSGASRIMIDTETGIWLRCHTQELVEGQHGSYTWDLTYTIKDMSSGAAPDVTLFKLPDNLHEVKGLTPWNDTRINKQLAGKPAPDLQATDIQGKPVSLANLKGKTVLLDFGTTWCPPCQADAPSIEKLNQKYGNNNLAVVGISVSEDRDTVEKYLKKHPHSYPVVLSSENQLPRPYQIGIFPTYLIIAPDGTLVTAEQGDKGFGKLRKELEKAGLEAE
jgi:thiol-disulfide isomerase/thioredoxin